MAIKDIIKERKFNDTVEARAKKVRAEYLALQINMRKEKAGRLFDTFFTPGLLKMLAAGKTQEAYESIVDKAGKMLQNGDLVGPPQNLGQFYSLAFSHPADYAEAVFTGLLPDMPNRAELFGLLAIDKKVVIRDDADQILGLNQKSDNVKVSTNERMLSNATRWLEAVAAESKKAAKSFQELGIVVSNQFLFKCAELGAGIAFGQIIDKAILAERQNHFHAFGGEEFTPVGTSQGAISDAVAMRYRPIYALLQLIDSGKHYTTDVARIMSESYLEVSEDGTVKLAKTAKQLLEDEFSLWTHNFKANKILQNIDGFRKMRKEIEGAGMTLAEFGLLTAEVPQFGQLAQLFEKKS
jgi:hypothetical protein